MPTINQVIARVDEARANAVPIEQKAAWLIELDGKIYDETHKGLGDAPPRRFPEDGDVPLLAGVPYDGMYDMYLYARIDLAEREISSYNNGVAVFSEALAEYQKHYNRTHLPPWRGNFIV